MSNELRAQKREPTRDREAWITKFVNAIVRDLRPGLDRMVAVHAAREEWPTMQATAPHLAAKEWIERGKGVP
jgi:hypothetical protein